MQYTVGLKEDVTFIFNRHIANVIAIFAICRCCIWNELQRKLELNYCFMFVAARMGNQSHFDYNIQRTNGIEGKARRGKYSVFCKI